MKNKLVTLFGGGGFVGRYAVQALLAAGARVRIAQRNPRGAAFLRTQGGLGQTQFIAADVRRRDSVERAVAGADAVVNLVGTFDGDLNAIHVEGARTIASEAAAAGARALVHLSAIGADPAAASNYARTKGEGEGDVRAEFPHATILRPSTVFGLEDAFVNRFAAMASRMPVLPVLHGGTRFQPVFVADVAHAIVTALDDPKAFGGRVFELGGPDVMTMLELNRWIAGAIGRKVRIVELPEAMGGLLAALPGTGISKDQLKLLQRDSVVAPGAEGLAALGITPTPLASVAPPWLVRYRRHGRFTKVGTPA